MRAVVGVAWGLGALLGALAIFNLFLDAALSLYLVGGVAAFLMMFGAALMRVPMETPAKPAPASEPLPDPAVLEARRNLLMWRRR